MPGAFISFRITRICGRCDDIDIFHIYYTIGNVLYIPQNVLINIKRSTKDLNGEKGLYERNVWKIAFVTLYKDAHPI